MSIAASARQLGAGKPEAGEGGPGSTDGGQPGGNQAGGGHTGGRRRRQEIFGLRTSAVLETVIFLALALIADRLWGSGDRFAEVSPHPFWAIVLLVSVQYGSKEGLFAAAAATAAFRLGNMPPQSIDQTIETWLLELWLQPFLWFGAALVLGELQVRHLRERARLDQELAQSRRREQVMAEAHHNLVQLKNTLEASVAGQLDTVFNIYNASRAIEKLGVGEVLIGITDLVRSVLRPTKFSLFLLNRGILEAAVNEGWSGQDRFETSFGASTLLFESIVARRHMLAAVRPADEYVLGPNGLLAGPLVSRDTGEIIGMLKIEAIPFAGLTPVTVQNFSVLCDWIGTAFANARRFEESRESGVFDPLRNLLSANFFEHQRTIVKRLAERMKFDVMVLFVRVDLPATADADQRIAVARMVAAAADAAIRTTDLRFDYRHNGWDFAVILAGTPMRDMQIVITKLVTAIERQLAAAHIDGKVAHSIESLHQCR